MPLPGKTILGFLQSITIPPQCRETDSLPRHPQCCNPADHRGGSAAPYPALTDHKPSDLPPARRIRVLAASCFWRGKTNPLADAIYAWSTGSLMKVGILWCRARRQGIPSRFSVGNIFAHVAELHKVAAPDPSRDVTLHVFGRERWIAQETNVDRMIIPGR